MNNLQQFPPIRWAMVHPRFAAWLVLSIGMIILLVIEAQNIGLTMFNWIALIAACIAVAGACVWIISWEDSDEEDEPPTVESAAKEMPANPEG